jgi:hypothetical protein
MPEHLDRRDELVEVNVQHPPPHDPSLTLSADTDPNGTMAS